MFNIITQILHKKDVSELSMEMEHEFSPYMIQRWCSMYSNDMIGFINDSTNLIRGGLDTNNQWYKLFMSVYPTLSYKRIKYIKKNKESDTRLGEDMSDVIKLLAEEHQMSIREVEEYVSVGKVDLKKIAKAIRS